MRKPFLVAVLVVLATLGAWGPVAAAQTSSAKVVIIVGADTPQYLDDADSLYVEAIKHTPNVIRVYSPNATWSAVKSATNGANVVIYLGHGNGWPSPYTYDPSYTTKDGFGLNASAAGTHGNLKYYGEPSIRTLQLAPKAVVLLFHLCYASGNSEPGKAQPSTSIARQRVDNYGSAFLAAGASAVIADGHSHSGYYIESLFTNPQSLGDYWRGAPTYNGNEIAFSPTRSTGSGFMDPDNGGATPSSFYRSFVGDPSVMTHTILGLKLPPGVRGAPGVTILPTREAIIGSGSTTPRTRGTATTTTLRGITLPTR